MLSHLAILISQFQVPVSVIFSKMSLAPIPMATLSRIVSLPYLFLTLFISWVPVGYPGRWAEPVLSSLLLSSGGSMLACGAHIGHV